MLSPLMLTQCQLGSGHTDEGSKPDLAIDCQRDLEDFAVPVPPFLEQATQLEMSKSVSDPCQIF